VPEKVIVPKKSGITLQEIRAIRGSTGKNPDDGDADRIRDGSTEQTAGHCTEVRRLPYRWNRKVDVDEAVVVVMNVMDKNPDLPNWLIVTLNGSIADSDKKLVRYFFEEVKKHVPAALKYFEARE
jgi:hypothetical protein